MNDVIAPKWSSLKPKLVAAMIFLKLNMSLIPNILVDVAKSPIWSTLIPSRSKLPDDIDDFDDDEEEEEDNCLSPLPVESKETDYTC